MNISSMKRNILFEISKNDTILAAQEHTFLYCNSNDF